MTYKCGNCDGKGYTYGTGNGFLDDMPTIGTGMDKCPICKGTGQVPERRSAQRRQGEGRRRYDGAEP